MNLYGVPIRRPQLVAFGGDFVVILVSLYLGHFLRFTPGGTSTSLAAIFDLTTGASVFFVATHLVMLYVLGAYELKRDAQVVPLVTKLWMGAIAAFIIQMAIFYAAPNWQWGRGVTILGFSSFVILVTCWRMFSLKAVPYSAGRARTIIVGGGSTGRAVADLLLRSPGMTAAYQLLGFVDDPTQEVRSYGFRPTENELSKNTLDLIRVLGTPGDLPALVRRNDIQQIIVANEAHLPDSVTTALLQLKGEGIKIVDMATFYKTHSGRLPIHHIVDGWMIFAPGFAQPSRVIQFVTRTMDLLLAVTLGILTLPLLIGAAIAIKLSSKGPIFYSQERLGLNQTPFTIYKLRTMRTDAETRTGAVWSQGATDPRVTTVGRILRRTRIDELPQLYNVLRGDMAMVGPRPEREHFVRMLEREIPYYRLRFAAKPGVTGWAQISFRYGASVNDAAMKLEYELYGIQEANPILYVLVLVKTVQTVLFKPGS